MIDPQRDIDRYLKLAEEEGLTIVAATETHIHADFLSGCRELVDRIGARVYLSNEGDAAWKYRWPEIGSDRVRLVKHGDHISIGKVDFEAVHTPGHTPEHLSFMVTDRGGGADRPMGMATGDFVFVADVGRPDLLESAAGQVGNMEPSARTLYRSICSFLELPDYLRVWPGHGAGSACGKALGAVPDSTVGYERRFNASIAAASGGEDAFVEAILEGQPEPPLYFARMKTQNKEGPALLGKLPQPYKLSPSELGELSQDDDSVIVDTRGDRSAFMQAHLPRSLYAPLDRSFPTIAGSYIAEGTRIYLLAEVEQVEEAVRDLIRIGFDDVAGFATADTLAEVSPGLATTSTEVVDFQVAKELAKVPGTRFLDVRRRAEFEQGHLPDACNIAHTRLLAKAAELSPESRHLVHCLTGERAASASSLLERLGKRVVYVDDRFELALAAPQAPGGEAATAAGQETE